MFDEAQLRSEFPILQRQLNGKPIVFADNAATSLKPKCVIDAVEHYYTQVCANVHRGVNLLAQEADKLYEEARASTASLIDARSDEIVFVRNTTEAINLASHILDLDEDDEVVCSLTDHHSNFLPWFVRAKVRLAQPDQAGRVSVESFRQALTPRTKLVAIGHVSNVTGVITPVHGVVEEARKRGIPTLIDGAQSVAHIPTNVHELGCDFFAFSGHKMLGPSGIGALYGRKELLDAAAPMLFGGGMVIRVSESDYEPEEVPHRFEAGTPNIEGAIGMGAAARFLTSVGLPDIYEHSLQLAEALVAEVATIPGLRTFPPDNSAERLPVVSFAVGDMPADDVAAILCNRYNIMVRSGVHCAEPLLRHFGVNGLTRISLHVYNTGAEVEHIGRSLREFCRFFS